VAGLAVGVGVGGADGGGGEGEEFGVVRVVANYWRARDGVVWFWGGVGGVVVAVRGWSYDGEGWGCGWEGGVDHVFFPFMIGEMGSWTW